MPFRAIEFHKPIDNQIYETIINFADQEIQAKNELLARTTDREKTYYEQKCAALDRQIDHLVYKLYDLTDDEIRIVEENGKNDK